MRLFGSERLIGVFNSLGIPEGEQIQHKMLSSAIERAQKKIESNNFSIRKNLLEYDQVMNDQRELVYAQRKRVLDGENMKPQVQNMIREEVRVSVETVLNDGIAMDEWDLPELNRIFDQIIPLPPVTQEYLEEHQIKSVKSLEEALTEDALALYDAKEAEFPTEEEFREVERVILLRVIDRHWMEEIDNMDQLRQGIGLQAYGQRNPIDEYKMQSYDMMDSMNAAIQADVVTMLFRIRVEKKVEREEVAKVTGTNKDDTASSGPKKRKAPKIYPNDPCPCGSGKKYKNCHGRQE
jgi:preprotein translocase subunit SecA